MRQLGSPVTISIITTLIIILGVVYMSLDQQQTKFNESTEIAVDVMSETLEPLVVDDSPEISNNDYNWLGTMSKDCYPSHNANVKEAFDNDGVIRQTEFSTILSRCSMAIEISNMNAKNKLKESLK